jgi:hypothetical protein
MSLEYKVYEKGGLVGTLHLWVVDGRGNGKSAHRLAKKLGDGSLNRFDFQINELNDLLLCCTLKNVQSEIGSFSESHVFVSGVLFDSG